MADLKIDIATVFSGKKAFSDASKATIGLNKQVNTLAKSFLGLFTAQKLARGGFNAAKAFAADDKAARVLSRSLDNLGLAFADPAIKTFIADLEKQFGVLDDQLRPAFQRLLTTTGDVTKSQQLLRTALDLSAASGLDVATVAGDLSKGYVGQTRALAKYGLGLTAVQLKAMSFVEIQAKINALFGGQAENAVNTYAGSFDKLNVAAKNAQETIGKGLINALTTLGGNGQGGLDNIITKIDATANAIAGLASGTAKAFKLLDTILNLQFTRIPGIFAKPAGKASITPAVAAELNKAAIEKAALKRTKEQSTVIAKNTKAIKDQTALQKAGTLFDVEQTGIVAALKGRISEDERKRLELQLALLTGNTTEASKLAGEIGKAQGLSVGLIAYLKNLPDAKNPFSGWAAYLDAIEAQVKRIALGGTSMGTSVGGTIAGGSMTSGPIPGSTQVFPGDFGDGGAAGAPVTVVVNVAGSVVTEGELVDKVRNGLLNSSLSGAGSLVARRTGTFATL